jgi:hypothetical protein
MGILVLAAGLLIFLAVTVWYVVAGWNTHSEVAISGHGYTAMALGIAFSLIVGVGLMSLVFYSSRKGYDEPVERKRSDQE